MSHAKRRREREDAPPEAVKARRRAGPHSNDNQPFDDTAWRRKYMRLYMQKRRARERAAKEGGAGGLAGGQAGGRKQCILKVTTPGKPAPTSTRS